MKPLNRQTGAFLLAIVIFLMVVGSLFLASMTNLSSVSSSGQSVEHTSNIAEAAAQSGLGYGILQRLAKTPNQKIYCDDALVSTEIAPTPCKVSYCSSPENLAVDGTFTVSSLAICYGGSPHQAIRWMTQDVRASVLTGAYQVVPASRTKVPYQLSPAFGPAAGGTVVTITGAGFTNTRFPPPATDLQHVTFGGTPVTASVFGSNTTMTVTTPAHAAGTVDVVIIFSQKGTNEYPITLPNAFTYQ